MLLMARRRSNLWASSTTVLNVEPAFHWERPTPSDVRSAVTESFTKPERGEWFSSRLDRDFGLDKHVSYV